MRKAAELLNVGSCFNRAHAREMMFVLLSRDAAAPVAIRAWAEERIRIGKNTAADDQIREALMCADIMENERAAKEVAR